MGQLMGATALLILAMVPMVAVLAIWRERMRESSMPSLPLDFGEWMRIESKGPVCGDWGGQPVYEWLRVQLADGAVTDLTTSKPVSIPAGFRLVRLAAGPVVYWGFALDGGVPTQAGLPSSAVRARGFSLIELLIVVAMIGILTAIALPMYRGYVQQSAAKPLTIALLQLGQQVQAYGQDKDTYTGACSTTPVVANGQLSCPVANTTDYTVEVQGSGVVGGLVYTLTKEGLRATPSAPPGWPTSASCWVIDASGACAS